MVFLMLRLPINKTKSASSVVEVMIRTIGVMESFTKRLTPKEAKAPIPNCVAPIKAEALPVFLEKGASDNPAVLGFEIPKQARNKNSIAMVSYNPNRLLTAKIKKIKLIMDCEIKAAKMSCSLE